MPMVAINILSGHPKQKMVSRIAKPIDAQTGIAPDDIWIAFEDVEPSDW